MTYWPLVEIVQQVAEGEAEPRLRDLLSGEPEGGLVAERVAAVVGGGEHVAGSDEIAWAVRKLMEHLARERPVLILLDDLQWGEATFLDLVEHLVHLSRSAPILLVGLARPELLELRPAWPGLKVGLEALSGPESAMLIQTLLGERLLDERSRGRISAAAEGNPLFLEQMLAMLAEDQPAGELAIPPTIQALLGARLDRLEAGPRGAIQRASVIGQEFWMGALRELSPAVEQLGSSLLELVRAELIRPHDSTIPGEDAFRFAHILVRDAAYRALPKQERADLHERLATWFERLDMSRSLQHDEIVGYHLEQAFRYKTELGPANAETELLARSAGERLAAAGRRAYLRGDTPATVNLLGRAGDLLPARYPGRLELLPDLGAALMEAGDLERASILLDEAVQHAKPGAASLASILRQMIATQQDYDLPPEALPELDAAISAFESEGDQRGLARAWLLRGEIHNYLGEREQMGVAAARSAEHARRAGDHRAEAEALRLFGGALVYGPTPVSAGIVRLEEILAGGGSNRMVEAAVIAPLSALKGMAGDLDRARELVRRARRIYDELGLTFQLARLGFMSGRVERLAGNLEGAAQEFRQGCELLQAMGERGRLSGMAIELTNVLADVDELGEAEAWLSIAEDAMGPESAAQSFDLRASRARLAAARGEPGDETLAEEVRAQAAASDDYTWRADALCNFAVSSLASGRALEAEHFLRDALAVYEAKGDVVSAARVQALLDRLASERPA
ncbi:MAG TPA: hypothetical protein VES61_05420 [Gaiellaceae bacterium]|nr:hypothetical protein [Gaiellaceae bacterium]